MNVNAAGRVPAHHVSRLQRSTAEPTRTTATAVSTSPATTATAESTTTAVGTGGTTGAGDEQAAGPTTPGGNDTPFTHALERGNGQKVGIHRRMAAFVAAQQAEAGLGGPPSTSDEVDGTDPADGTDSLDGTVAPESSAGPAGDATPVDGEQTPVEGDPMAIGEDPTDQSGAVDSGAPVETIVVDGSELFGQAMPVSDGGVSLDELLQELAQRQGHEVDEHWQGPTTTGAAES